MDRDGPLAANKRVVRHFLDAVNKQDWSALDGIVAPDVVRHGSGGPAVRSLEGLREFLRGEARTFPDARETVQWLVAEGDMVAARLAFRGTQLGPLGPFPPSGRTLQADFQAMFRIAEGRVAEVWAVWDTLAALRELGHWPADPGPATTP
jgi:steroid delta-isomerase-like uncharacterized protein